MLIDRRHGSRARSALCSRAMPTTNRPAEARPTQHLPARRPSALARFARQPPPAEGGRAAAARRRRARPLRAAIPTTRSTSTPSRPALARADLLVLLHPIQWYSMPPLLKLWLDEVLALRLGLRPRRHARCSGKDLLAGRDHRRARDSATTRKATTATSSTPSCRPTSRPPRCAACASCRRCCSTARTARQRGELTAHVEVFKRAPRRPIPTGPSSTTWTPAPSCVVPARPTGRANSAGGLSMEHAPAWLVNSPDLPRRRGARGAAVEGARASARSSATSAPASPSARGAWAWSPTSRTSCTSPSSASC